MQKQLTRLKYRFGKAFRSHQAFVVIIAVLAALIAVIIRINSLANLPVDTAYQTQQTSQLKTVRFNQDAINKIQSLSASNVTTPGTQLPSGRQNPFNE